MVLGLDDRAGAAGAPALARRSALLVPDEPADLDPIGRPERVRFRPPRTTGADLRCSGPPGGGTAPGLALIAVTAPVLPCPMADRRSATMGLGLITLLR